MEWIASWLHQNSGISKELLDKIDGHDPENLRHVFAAATKVSLTTPLPRELQHKVTCGRVFTKRTVWAGKRLRTLARCVRHDGSIDWPAWGPFIFQWQEDVIVGIRHIHGDAVAPLPAHIVLNRSFTLNLPWSDFEASLSLDACSHTVHRIFPEGKGPNTEVVGRNGALLDGVTSEVVEEMEAETARAKQGAVEDDCILTIHDENATAKRKETLDAARKKLVASAARRRSLQLSVT